MGESTRGETHIKIAKHRNGALDIVKLRALLHIQKFEEWDDNDGFKPQGGNWKPLGPSPTPGSGSGDEAGGKFFIQKGSRMNSGSFDEGFEEETPF